MQQIITRIFLLPSHPTSHLHILLSLHRHRRFDLSHAPPISQAIISFLRDWHTIRRRVQAKKLIENILLAYFLHIRDLVRLAGEKPPTCGELSARGTMLFEWAGKSLWEGAETKKCFRAALEGKGDQERGEEGRETAAHPPVGGEGRDRAKESMDATFGFMGGRQGKGGKGRWDGEKEKERSPPSLAWWLGGRPRPLSRFRLRRRWVGPLARET